MKRRSVPVHASCSEDVGKDRLLAHASWRKDVERVSVGSGLLVHASWRKDVEVRVKGGLEKVNAGERSQ